MNGECQNCHNIDHVHRHHVVPKSLGGSLVVILCEECHGKVHGRNMRISHLTKKALSKVKNRTPEENIRLGKKPIGRPKGCDPTAATQASIVARRLSRDIKMRSATVIAKREREHGSTYRSIAEHFTSIGIKTSRGKEFTATAVRRLLV